MRTPHPRKLPLPLEGQGAVEGSAQPAICCGKPLGLLPSRQTHGLSFLPSSLHLLLPRLREGHQKGRAETAGRCSRRFLVWPGTGRPARHRFWAARSASRRELTGGPAVGKPREQSPQPQGRRLERRVCTAQ